MKIRPNVSEQALRPFEEGGLQKKYLVTAVANAKAMARDTGQPLDTAYVAKVEAAIAARHKPRAHPSLTASTPTSRVMDLIRRFERERERGVNFRAADARYLKQLRALLSRRKRNVGKGTTGIEELKARLDAEVLRPRIDHDTDIELLRQLQSELQTKKDLYPELWQSDEVRYERRLKEALRGARKKRTNAKKRAMAARSSRSTPTATAGAKKPPITPE